MLCRKDGAPLRIAELLIGERTGEGRTSEGGSGPEEGVRLGHGAVRRMTHLRRHQLVEDGEVLFRRGWRP